MLIGVVGVIVVPLTVMGLIVPGVVPCAVVMGVTVRFADATWPWNAAADDEAVTVNDPLIVCRTVTTAVVVAVTVNDAATD
jgi:hypothetical protein